jgi:hypothetical protein
MATQPTTSKAGGVRAVKMVFHPTIHVPTLDESEEFFDHVFARSSQLLEVMPRSAIPSPPHAPKGYSKFTPIGDVLIDSVCPALHLTDGVQHFESVDRPTLFNIGWYCDDIYETFRLLKGNGIPLMTQFGRPADGDEPPTADQGGDVKQFFTPPHEMGLRYQFIAWFRLHVDPRSAPGWSLPAVSDDDPLGIERLSHHVIVTEQPERALRLVVDVLGGEVIHEGRDELRGISGPYVHLADAVFHYAVPDQGTPAATALAAKLPADQYLALTWKVADLDRVERHLASAGVKIASRTDDTLVTDASTSFDVPWGFTARLTPGDPRDTA